MILHGYILRGDYKNQLIIVNSVGLLLMVHYKRRRVYNKLSSIGIFGSLISLIIIIIPIAIVVFLLVWTHPIKTNSEIQVQQNQRLIDLLEELNNT